MKNWQILIDQKIRESIGDGDVSHLPGAGKPLNLDDDPYTPSDQRSAFKIMKENNVVPDWMMVGKALEQAEEKLHKQIESRATHYQRHLADGRRKDSILEETKIENSWNTYIEEFTDRVERLNKEILLYNLSVPRNIPHKQILVCDNLIATALQSTEGDD